MRASAHGIVASLYHQYGWERAYRQLRKEGLSWAAALGYLYGRFYS